MDYHFDELPKCWICGELVITIDDGYYCDNCEFREFKVALTTFEDIQGLTKNSLYRMDEFRDRIQKVSIKNPVKSKVIERKIGLKGVEVRGLVNYLRKKGFPIGSSSKGYWYANNKEEIVDTIKHLHQRKLAIEHVISGLENSSFLNKQESLFA